MGLEFEATYGRGVTAHPFPPHDQQVAGFDRIVRASSRAAAPSRAIAQLKIVMHYSLFY
jgi:hypothetical protein